MLLMCCFYGCVLINVLCCCGTAVAVALAAVVVAAVPNGQFAVASFAAVQPRLLQCLLLLSLCSLFIFVFCIFVSFLLLLLFPAVRCLSSVFSCTSLARFFSSVLIELN